MISLNAIVRQLTAAWFLFLDRAGAVRLFDTTVDGFWKSFQAALLVLPFYAISVAADAQLYLGLDDPNVPFNPNAFLMARTLGFALDWVTLPLLLALLSPVLGIGNGYMAYVVARNWGAVLTSVPFALIAILDAAGVFPGESILFPAGVALAISLRISYLAARRALGVPIDVAIGFVALDFLVSLGLARAMARLFEVEL